MLDKRLYLFRVHTHIQQKRTWKGIIKGKYATNRW